MILYLISIFAQPKLHDRGTMLFLRLHFISAPILCECALTIYEIRRGRKGFALVSLGRGLLLILLFHCGLKLRASIGRLPNKDLEIFLVETLFKGGFETIASVLFILFRSTKCSIERDLETCRMNTSCASYLSVMIITYWGLKIVHGSIKSEWRKELSISMEKVARMKISWRQCAEGLLLAVMAGESCEERSRELSEL